MNAHTHSYLFLMRDAADDLPFAAWLFGTIAPIDLAGRGVSGCSVLSQLKNGSYVRVEPTKPGTFACPKNGRILRKLDLLGTS